MSDRVKLRRCAQAATAPLPIVSTRREQHRPAIIQPPPRMPPPEDDDLDVLGRITVTIRRDCRGRRPGSSRPGARPAGRAAATTWCSVRTQPPPAGHLIQGEATRRGALYFDSCEVDSSALRSRRTGQRQRVGGGDGRARASAGSVVDRRRGRSWRALACDLGALVLVGVAYYLGARLGLSLSLVEHNVTPLWPPTGIAVAAFLLFGRSLWPALRRSLRREPAGQ